MSMGLPSPAAQSAGGAGDVVGTEGSAARQKTAPPKIAITMHETLVACVCCMGCPSVRTTDYGNGSGPGTLGLWRRAAKRFQRSSSSSLLRLSVEVPLTRALAVSSQ